MKTRFLRIVCICTCLVASAGLSALAQGKPPGGGGPGGPPPGGYGPGGPGGPSAPGGPGGPPSSSSKSASANNTAHGAVQIGPVGRWWDDKTVVQAVGIGKVQQKQMDATFSANKPAILNSYKTFLSEQAKLNALSKDPNADKERLFAAIDAVNQARAALQKATTQMQLQIRQQMNPEQIQKLEKLH